MSSKITIVYHPDCTPSMKLMSAISILPGVDKEYINYKEDEIDSQINIDKLPLIILNESDVYKGIKAFEKIKEMSNPTKNIKKKSSYDKKVVFIEDKDKKKERIDLDKR